MMKILIFLPLLLSLIACAEINPEEISSSSISVSDHNYAGNITVKLGIYDGSPKSLVIQDNGTMMFIEQTITDRIELPSYAIESLRKVIESNQFFSLSNEYVGAVCDDCFSYTLIITIDETSHTIYCGDGYGCPAPFNTIKDKIIALWPSKINYSGFT